LKSGVWVQLQNNTGIHGSVWLRRFWTQGPKRDGTAQVKRFIYKECVRRRELSWYQWRHWVCGEKEAQLEWAAGWKL